MTDDLRQPSAIWSQSGSSDLESRQPPTEPGVRCPTCGHGTLTRAEVNEPARYSCDHEYYVPLTSDRIGLVHDE